MAIDCDPNALMEASKCFCIPPGKQQEVIIWLLQQIAGNTMTPAQLAEAAKCYCFDQKTAEGVITYLLCILANGGSGACTLQEGAGSPVGSVTPDFIGQLYHDTVADTYYRSTGLTSADWVVIGSGSDLATMLAEVGTRDLVLSNYTTLAGDVVVGLTDTQGYAMVLAQLPNVTSYSFPNLTTLLDALTIGVNPLCTSIDLPALITVSLGVNVLLNPLLTAFSAPNWIPTDGTNIDFTGNALDQTSVDAILAQADAALFGTIGGLLDLSGGTNSVPSAAGLVSKANINARTPGACVTN